jgi:PTS system cellobiose-specific IIA component
MLDLEESIFKIISYSGDAKSSLVEAINLAKQKKFDEALQKVKNAQVSKVVANETHLELVSHEANEKDFKMSLLLAHCEDQMMSIECFELIAKELIYLYQNLKV